MKKERKRELPERRGCIWASKVARLRFLELESSDGSDGVLVLPTTKTVERFTSGFSSKVISVCSSEIHFCGVILYLDDSGQRVSGARNIHLP